MLKLVDSSPNNRIIPYEDVYFTGIIAGMFLKLPLTLIDGIYMEYDNHFPFDQTHKATELIASHKHNKDEIEEMWNDITEYRKTKHMLSI